MTKTLHLEIENSTIIGWIAGVVGLSSAWVGKMVFSIVAKNWQDRKDSIDERLNKLESGVTNISKVIFFPDPSTGKDTDLHVFAIHKFGNLKNDIKGLDNFLGILEKTVKNNSVDEKALLNEILKKLEK